MRCVLIRPLNKSTYYDPEIQEPLGLEYLASILKQSANDILILDSALDNLNDIKLARRTVSFEPDLIGFSITTIDDIDSVLSIYSECRKLLSEKKIKWIAGGNLTTIDASTVKKLLSPDFFLVRYEGEIAVQELVSEWRGEKGSQLTSKQIIDGRVIEDLDSLPFPERPYYQYLKTYGWAFNIQGSRGCCSSCKYCASSGMRNKTNKSWRGRTTVNIVGELLYLHERYNADTFNFVDEDFLGPPAKATVRARSFSLEVRKHNLDISFGIQVRPNSLSEEIIDYLVKSGLKYVFMGIESDDQGDLKKWGRLYCEETWKWIDLLQSKEVEVNAGTLLFHPDCTLQSIRRFSTKLIKYQLFNYRTAINRMDAMPGSYFHKEYLSSHKNSDHLEGIFSLPFNDNKIDSFYSDINKALEPIGSTSMHAICSLPTAQTNRKISELDESQYHRLKELIRLCDNQVSKCFLLILTSYENNANSEKLIEELANENLIYSKDIADQLIAEGFVRSPEMLYKAIHHEG